MTDPRALRCGAVAGWMMIASAIVGAGACAASDSMADPATGGDDQMQPPGEPPGDPPPPPAVTAFDVQLVADGVTGTQRVNFAIPLARGTLSDGDAVKLSANGVELPAARRVLARFDDGSARSVQIQVDADAAATLHVELGAPGATGIAMMDVDATLAGSGNDRTPKVWALLPADVLANSQLFGPLAPRVAGDAHDPWATLCDYNHWDTDTFLAGAASRDVWLYDRVTAMYRGYAVTGDRSPLRSAYREAGIYRTGMSISNGVATDNGIPTAADDLKYYYSQGMALHYLLTGDDRFREAAEAVSARVVTMWNPVYDGGDRFWTERHAGFSLLAHEWALRVTDDQADTIAARAETAVTAFLAVQAAAQGEADARCFGHTATAHGEDFGTTGCSPWMSAILADGLDAYATRVGGARAGAVRDGIAKLARAIVRHGRDADGRPYYWMTVDGGAPELDDYEEHWGESAYIAALGWVATGRTDAELRTGADALTAGMAAHGEVGQIRSFNWQCRSAIATPALLR